MALRSLDNALPITPERPKKVAKVSTTTGKILDIRVNDENAAPPSIVDPIDYIASENLKALSDPETKIKTLMEGLESKDWTKACEALNDVRRFALHHSSCILPILYKIMGVLVKAMKNPRSALCKTAIMASSDILHAFGHQILSSSSQAFDHLLLQLLLKASQDKRFVCEEAEKVLQAMSAFVPPLDLLPKLQSYVNHANLRVRAKAAVSISCCVSKMGLEGMKEFGLPTLVRIAADLLNDRLPEAREAARSIANSIYTFAFLGDNELMATGSSSTLESWQDFCSSNLPPISAQSMTRIVSQ